MMSKRREGRTDLLRYLHVSGESRRSHHHLATRRCGRGSSSGRLIPSGCWPANAPRARHSGSLRRTCIAQTKRIARMIA